MAVLLNSALRGLTRPAVEKDRYYDMEAALVDVPILLMTFGEALPCDVFLARYGGHVWFDMVVPVMFTVYYVLLLLYPEVSKVATRPPRRWELSQVDLKPGHSCCTVHSCVPGLQQRRPWL